MRLTAARKLGLGLLGALVLAFAGSGLAYLSASRTAEALEDLVLANLEQSRAIYELEIALLEQGGFTASYLIDGATQWLDELARREPYFEDWLERVGRIGLEPGQNEYIDRISAAFREYDAVRDRAVRLYNEGHIEQARRVLLQEVSRQYDEVYRLCEELSLANNADIESAMRARMAQTRQVGVWVAVCLALLVALVAGLSWVLFARVFAPLRRMAEDARQYAGDDRDGLPREEVETVGTYLETLRTDVDEARTRLARSNRHLLDAEQMASLGRIAAGVAHEIRSPLTSLRLRLFSMQKALGDRHPADFQVLTEEVARLDSIVRNFLEFSRPPDLRLQRCSVSLVLDKTLELLRYKLDLLGAQVEREEPSALPAVWADNHQLRQVFLNLLNNALDVLPEGGKIAIGATEKATVARRAVVVTVRDNGPGMPEEAKERAFDPFFSTKEDGAGLGLWIARRIMTQHGGALDLVSSTEHGTTFAVAIPVASEESR